MLSTNLTPNRNFSLPLSVVYTWIDAQFDTDIADTDFFGDVAKGDPIPYIPKHQLQVSAGIEHARWKTYVSAHYVDETCVRASCGDFERTDDALSVDIAGHYLYNDNIALFARIENVTGEKDILGRHPYGARANKSRTLSGGVRFTF